MGQPQPWRSGAGNLLLASLSPADRRDLTSRYVEAVAFDPRVTLYDPDTPIEHVWFPESGLVSLLGVLTDGTAVETAIIGREGMVGMPIFHETDRMAEQAVVQLPLKALRMTARNFRLCLSECPALGLALHHYAAASHMFAAQSVACMAKHAISRRLARWLLHAVDQSGMQELAFTHLFLAHMLGVRRSSVSVAASELRALGLLEYTRSHMTITNHDALAAYSCACYQIIRSTYDRIMFGVETSNPLSAVQTSRDGVSTLDAPHGERESDAEPTPATQSVR
jgi:CRP-like cAMP-binding protein